MQNAIKIVEPRDIPNIVRIHKSCLPEDVFPNLGDQFLSKYYRRILEDDSQIIIGIYKENIVLGFCQIAIRDFNYLSLLDLKTILRMFKLAFFRPLVLLSGLIQLFKKFPLDPNTSEIAFIAVDKNFQGQGLGKLLIESANNVCSQNNKLFLQTKTSNQNLAQYYKSKQKAKIVRIYNILGSRYQILNWEIKK